MKTPTNQLGFSFDEETVPTPTAGPRCYGCHEPYTPPKGGQPFCDQCSIAIARKNGYGGNGNGPLWRGVRL